MRRDDDQHFHRANRLQHLATKALNKSNRCVPMSRAADHHYRRYLNLLHLAAAAWQAVDLTTHDRKYERMAA